MIPITQFLAEVKLFIPTCEEWDTSPEDHKHDFPVILIAMPSRARYELELGGVP